MKIILAENYTSAIVTKHADKYSHIVCSANTFGKNLMPRIAAIIRYFSSE